MNVVTLTGRLTKEPELRYAAGSQTAVATFTLAVNRPYSKNNEADFIKIVAYGKTAELCKNYLQKGRLVGIKGRIQTSSYKTESGEKRYTTDVIAEQVEFLSPKSESKPAEANPNEVQDGDIPEGFMEYNEEDGENIPF